MKLPFDPAFPVLDRDQDRDADGFELLPDGLGKESRPKRKQERVPDQNVDD